MRLAYKIPGRGLTTGKLYGLAARYGWPLYQPDNEEYVTEFDRMTTLCADTWTGEVVFRKDGRGRWSLIETEELCAGDAVLDALKKEGLAIVPDFERCTLYH